jgi:Toxin co-regulated pilus biosynthesis protein Q
MKLPIVMPLNRGASLIAQLFVALSLTTVNAVSSAAVDPDQSRVAPPAGDGWQMLSGAMLSTIAGNGARVSTPAAVNSVPAPVASPASAAGTEITKPVSAGVVDSSIAVTPVVLPSTVPGTAPGGILTLAITPQDINLRNALDRWLQQQGWQLAWKIDDDLPLEFNATFSGDFKSVLTQVMQATNHMRTPTRVCKHTNNVIRVVARAANCQD